MDDVENLENLYGNKTFREWESLTKRLYEYFPFFKVILGLKKVFGYMIKEKFLCMALKNMNNHKTSLQAATYDRLGYFFKN